MSANERFVSRRDFLFRAGEGISGIALAHMLQQEGLLAAETACDAQGIASPTAPREPHFKPRAKAVISLFMSGGVSHVDTFDHKPMLEKHHGQPLTGKGRVRVRQGYPGPLMRSPFKFQRYGGDLREGRPALSRGVHIDEEEAARIATEVDAMVGATAH